MHSQGQASEIIPNGTKMDERQLVKRIEQHRMSLEGTRWHTIDLYPRKVLQ